MWQRHNLLTNAAGEGDCEHWPESRFSGDAMDLTETLYCISAFHALFPNVFFQTSGTAREVAESSSCRLFVSRLPHCYFEDG